MDLRALVLSCVVVLFAPASASAEEAAALDPQVEQTEPSSLGIYAPLPDASVPDGRSPPELGLSVGLHVTAAIMGIVASAGTMAGALLAITCRSDGYCAVWLGMALTSAVLVTAAFAIGISASSVHAHLRTSAGLQLLPPSVWADATGGGAALTLRF
jgi:hypothetical protein